MLTRRFAQVGEKTVEWDKDVKKLTAAQTETALSELLRQKWINRKGGQYTLSVRTMCELQDWISRISAGEDELQCICDSVVIQGERCSNGGCNKKLHFHCLRKYAEQYRGDVPCPFCQQKNTFHIPAPVASQDETPSSGARGRSRRPAGGQGVADEPGGASARATGGRPKRKRAT
jgi:hypothetical protein